MRSMTGFGQAQRTMEGVHHAVEIRSVNSRYFKATIRLPDLWSAMEIEIDRRLRERLARGSVNFLLRVKFETDAAASEVNIDALERYIEQLEVVRGDADVPVTVDLATLLTLPGVCNPPPTDEFVAQAKGALMELIEEAVDELLRMRAREGAVIAADLTRHCDVIEQQLAEVGARAGLVVAEYHQRLARRVEELTAKAELSLSDQDLAREVAVFAERCDISEEISRLGGHVEQFRAAMGSADQAGRKLDFLAQEMLREANTMSAKSNDGQIARAAVEMKTAIDRIKEQVQNVE